jgi:hypothetical protein
MSITFLMGSGSIKRSDRQHNRFRKSNRRTTTMRRTPWLLAEPYRLQAAGYESRYGDGFGAFRLPHRPTGADLLVIACDGRLSREEHGDSHAWDHVSVSAHNRTPNWAEMAFVKSVFWDDGECVMELHVPATEHINYHPHVLHLWMPLLVPIPRPPGEMVGPGGTRSG